MAEKNVWISVILSLFLAGLGNAYNGLYKRFIVQLVIRLVLIAGTYLRGILGLIFILIGLIWQVYCIYDSYACTVAINEGSSIPLLAGTLDIE